MAMEPAMATMLNAVFSWPSWGTEASRAALISGMRRLSATICGPVDAVESARAAVIHLVSRLGMSGYVVYLGIKVGTGVDVSGGLVVVF
jgi:hypothetical protein